MRSRRLLWAKHYPQGATSSMSLFIINSNTGLKLYSESSTESSVLHPPSSSFEIFIWIPVIRQSNYTKASYSERCFKTLPSAAPQLPTPDSMSSAYRRSVCFGRRRFQGMKKWFGACCLFSKVNTRRLLWAVIFKICGRTASRPPNWLNFHLNKNLQNTQRSEFLNFHLCKI